MMESVLDFIILKFIMWIFPLRKIEDVSVGIRAILDPRTRPFGLDDRVRSGICLFRLYVLMLHLFMHGLPLF